MPSLFENQHRESTQSKQRRTINQTKENAETKQTKTKKEEKDTMPTLYILDHFLNLCAPAKDYLDEDEIRKVMSLDQCGLAKVEDLFDQEKILRAMSLDHCVHGQDTMNEEKNLKDMSLDLCTPGEDFLAASNVFGSMSFDHYSDGETTEPDSESEYASDSQETGSLDGQHIVEDRGTSTSTLMTCPPTIGVSLPPSNKIPRSSMNLRRHTKWLLGKKKHGVADGEQQR